MKAEFGNLEQIKLLHKEQRNKADEAEAKKPKRYETPLQEFIDIESDLGWHYFQISNIAEHSKNDKPFSAIDKLIDNATGYSKAKLLENSKLVLRHLSAIKRCKNKLNKKFNREYSLENDLNNIVAIKKIIKKLL